MADPRAGDVAEAERLLAQAADDGIARLPVLSAAELWVLCGETQVLADEAELSWWRSKPETEREQYAVAMTDLLVDRELIRPPEDPAASTAPMTAELAMIVAARQMPAVVVVCTSADGADGAAGDAPRMYGLAEGERPPRVLVSEIVSPARKPAFGPLHHFSLVSPQRAGRILALWAAAPAASAKVGAAERMIDVYRNRPGEGLTKDRVVVGAAAGVVEATRERPGSAPEPPSRCGPDELARLVTSVLLEPAP